MDTSPIPLVLAVYFFLQMTETYFVWIGWTQKRQNWPEGRTAVGKIERRNLSRKYTF